ncbi:hypothetical protein [Arthrobacter sp. OY3WO11]|uniref:hypothetical protein n=1 Tax=Arthrobacter sp. OY3WO11 TaxID=1835723 RepID=UPI0007CFB31A|nr:hypothetical protein [Arthrobacter sp. OY3WO11]OAD97742.1 hypothetical protein A6A22_20280 [Arthrobacter sp. OY3WO11]
MTDFPAASAVIEVRPVETADSNPLHMILARKVWIDHPRILFSYDATEDTLILRVVELPSIYSMSSEESVFVGFDSLGEAAWPTTIAISSASRTFFENNHELAVVRELIGEAVYEAVKPVLTSGESRSSTVDLTAEQGRALHTRWNGTTTVPEATTAEEMTDDILETVLLSWAVELAPALLRDSTTFDTIDSTELPDTIRRSAAVADEGLFQLIVGRKRRTIEPWPVARLDLDRKGEDYLVSVVVPLPQEPPTGITISANVTINGQVWSISLEKDQAQDRALSRKLVGCRLIPADALIAHQAKQTTMRLQIKAIPREQA